MGAVEVNVDKSEQVFTGEDRPFEYSCVDSAGAQLDVSSFALTWELKRSLDAAAALITKTVGSGITVSSDSGGTNNLATVVVSDTDTEGLKPGTYFHVLRRTDSTNEVWMSFGKVTISSSGQTA